MSRIRTIEHEFFAPTGENLQNKMMISLKRGGTTKMNRLCVTILCGKGCGLNDK